MRKHTSNEDGSDAISGSEIAITLASRWPSGKPTRDVAGLPSLCFEALALGRKSSRLAGVASQLDRLVPSWPERAAQEITAALSASLDENHQRLCAALSQRPLARPQALLQALAAVDDANSKLWLLTALSGTDNSELRAWWREDLLRQARLGQAKPETALWFAFLQAFRRGWLSREDFNACLAEGRVLSIAASNGDYRAALTRLGLDANTTFSRWYRQLVYEISHQPDVALSYSAGGWIRDFPGEQYFRDALARLAAQPDDWWGLQLLAYTTGLEAETEKMQQWLCGSSPPLLCLVSLIRPALGDTVAETLGTPAHAEAAAWLRTASPQLPLDLRFIEQRLRPWAEQWGEAMTLACGALCSVQLPDDFPGPPQKALRRRAFACALAPGFDRIMSNLNCLHALRKEYLDHLLLQAARGRPMAARALGLWPEQCLESVPVLLRLLRGGTLTSRQAAAETLEILRAGAGVPDLAALERRLDLASAWSDGGLEGKSTRVWWDLAGYHLRLGIIDERVTLECRSARGRVRSLPKAVREHPQFEEVKAARQQLTRSYQHFREKLEQMMVEGRAQRGRDFALLLTNPAVRSLVSRLALLVDGAPFSYEEGEPFAEAEIPQELAAAAEVRVAHPLELEQRLLLSGWQRRVVEERIRQPFKQVFREVYVPKESESEERQCARFSGHALLPRRAYALLRSQGYRPGSGLAQKNWPSVGITAVLQWAGPHEQAGRLLGFGDQAGTVTSGSVWFVNATGDMLPLKQVPPVIFSETLREADLLVSRAAAGDLGFSSEETMRLRAVLIQQLVRLLGLTNVYVSDQARYVIVEGRRARYRVHLGSGSVLLEESRRSLEVNEAVLHIIEPNLIEGMDAGTDRVLRTVFALARDEYIEVADFLLQLGEEVL